MNGIGALGRWAACLWLGFLSPGCGAQTQPHGALRIYAAASLRDVIEECGRRFTDEQGVELVVVTGGSNLLAEQLKAGAPADVLISAGMREVEALVAGEVLHASSRRALFNNQLVIVVAEGNPEASSLWRDPMQGLLAAGRISLAHTEAVPAGRYACSWLEREGLWEGLRSRVVCSLDVRAALAAVASGGVEVGIVYKTDAMQSDQVDVVYHVPVSRSHPIAYVGAVTQSSPQAELASRFLDFICTDARDVLVAHGFMMNEQGNATGGVLRDGSD